MRRMLLAAIAVAVCSGVAAQKLQQEWGGPQKPLVETIAVPDHSDSRYCLGQTARLRIVAREGGVPLEGGVVRYRVGPDMLLPEAYDTVRFVGGEATIPMGTLNEPGFLACQYEFVAGGKRYSDLVKVAYEPELISSFSPMPADFVKFWRKALAEARKVDLEPTYFDVPEATNDSVETKLVRLHVGKEKWIYGYLTRPRDGKPHPVVLTPPGAGSNKIFPSDYYPRRGMTYLKIEIHGNDQRLDDAAYNQLRSERCKGYMSRGMASRDTYYYKDVYVGCARAVDFLCSLPDWDGRNVVVTGGSQGGALTLITAALNEKVSVCAAFYPALCDLLGFLHHRAGGWPKFFSNHDDGQVDIPQAETEAVLPYFDVVNFCRMLKCPTFVGWGYSDNTCSPTSVWAAWNEIKAEKQSCITPTSGHWRFTGTQDKAWEWIEGHLR